MFIYANNGRYETAYPLHNVKRVTLHRGLKGDAPEYTLHLISGDPVSTPFEPPHLKTLLRPKGWERWGLNAVIDMDQAGQPLICHWQTQPVMSVTECTPIPSGPTWFDELSTHPEIEEVAFSLVVDTQRNACWGGTGEQWSPDLGQAIAHMLESLKRKHPELVVSQPPWLAEAIRNAYKPLRKTKAA